MGLCGLLMVSNTARHTSAVCKDQTAQTACALAVYQCNMEEKRSCYSQLAENSTVIFHYSRLVDLIIY